MLIKRISGQKLVAVQASEEVNAEIQAQHVEQLAKLTEELQTKRAQDPREDDTIEDA